MLKLKKAWVVVALSMLSLLVLSFGALAADEPSAQTAGTVTVGEGEDAAEYDLNAVRGDEDAGVLGAIDYTGSYADNLQSDENFEENVDKAIATVHTEIPAYATFWALLPPLIAIRPCPHHQGGLFLPLHRYRCGRRALCKL